jgi:hypothetical protein
VVSFTPLPLYPREKAPGTHFIGGWVDPRTGQDNIQMNLTGTGYGDASWIQLAQGVEYVQDVLFGSTMMNFRFLRKQETS